MSEIGKGLEMLSTTFILLAMWYIFWRYCLSNSETIKDNVDNYEVGDKVSIYGYIGTEPDVIYANHNIMNGWGCNIILIPSATIIGKQYNARKSKYIVEVYADNGERKCFVVDKTCLYLGQKSNSAKYDN